MDYFKAGGVCLLFVFIAAALPIGGFAATPSDVAVPGSNPADTSASGASPVVSENSISKGVDIKSIGATEAPIKVQRPSSGIRPGAAIGASTPAVSAAPAVSEATKSATSEAAKTSADQPSAKSAETKTATVASSTKESTQNSAQITPPQAYKTQAIANLSPSSANSDNLTSKTSASQNKTLTTSDVNKALANNSETNMTINTTPSTTENKTEQIAPTVQPAFTDRIWDEDRSPLDYTWTPLVFSGFFYDLDDGVGNEKLIVHLTPGKLRTIAEKDLKYETTVQPINFKFKDWGQYQVIGFMADKYFAGYSGTKVVDKEISLINEGQLRQVLMDNDDEKTIVQGSVLPLEEGYELRIKEIDTNGNKVYLALAKDGKEIDSKVISPGTLKSSTYQYKVTVGGEDIPIIMAHIPSVFAGSESGIVSIDGLFQVSDTYKSVETGDNYGKMEVDSVSDTGVTMKNKDSSISLGKGKVVDIFQNVKFQVADAAKVRFAPIVERTGSYEIRGTIVPPILRNLTGPPTISRDSIMI